jgi:hypothetical protein
MSVPRRVSNGSVNRSAIRQDRESRLHHSEENAAPANGDLNTNELCLWFDSTNGSAKLMIKAKDANGVVVTGSVALT